MKTLRIDDLSDDEFPEDIYEGLKSYVYEHLDELEIVNETIHENCECCKMSSFVPAEYLQKKKDSFIVDSDALEDSDEESAFTIVQGSSQEHAIDLYSPSTVESADVSSRREDALTPNPSTSIALDLEKLKIHSDEESDEESVSSSNSSSSSEPPMNLSLISFETPGGVIDLMSSSEDEAPPVHKLVSKASSAKRMIILSDSSSDEEEEDATPPPPSPQQLPPRKSIPKRTLYDLSSEEDEVEWSSGVENESVDIDDDEEPFSDGDSFIENDITLSSDDEAVERNKKVDKGFKKKREQLSQYFFDHYDKTVFYGKLAAATKVEWSAKLRTTAGHTKMRTTRQLGQSEATRSVVIELSTKVLDSEHRLRSTLLHECCHAAAFLIDGVTKPPHGKCFKKWANRSMQKIPDLTVTTTHSYEIQFSYAWACQTPKCGAIFKRHSRSIDPSRQVCGRCKGKLVEIEANKDDIVPKKRAPLSAYNLFVRDQTPSVRKFLEAEHKRQGIQDKVSQSEVMKECARRWKENNSNSNAA